MKNRKDRRQREREREMVDEDGFIDLHFDGSFGTEVGLENIL